MISRRTFVASAIAVLATPLTVEAQRTARAARVGVLSFDTPEPFRERFRQALLELGYVEGRNLTLENRWGDGQTERLAGLAEELVRANVDVIVANVTPCVQAAQAATRTIPIVMAPAGDALGTRLVDNLARPGGNITGLSLALIELAGKTAALLHEAVPQLRTIACVVDRADPLHRGFLGEVESSAKRLGLGFRPFVLGSNAELDGAIAAISREKSSGVIFQPIFAIAAEVRATIVRLTLQHRLPSVSGLRRFAEAGGLVAYSSEFSDTPKRVAVYVDKILKGARPGELPVEQPTRFDLVFNIKTAKALGLTVPPALLLRADSVIE